MQTQVQLKADADHLETLIANLQRTGENKLLIEHLQTASAYLQGAMPEECAHNLKMASIASDTLSDPELKSDLQHTIHEMLDLLHPGPGDRWTHHATKWDAHPVQPQPTVKGLDAFFHGHDVRFGIFYPSKHVVAVFHTVEAAQAGSTALSLAGFQMWEIIAVPGDEVKRFLQDLREHHALWSALMTELSRIFDTEATLVDDYERWARLGGGFLIASSPTQQDAEGIFERIKPLKPVAVHWFMPGYIRHLM